MQELVVPEQHRRDPAAERLLSRMTVPNQVDPIAQQGEDQQKG